MGVSNIKERLIANMFDGGVKIDGLNVGVHGGQFLDEGRNTWTKVVLPVPDMPMTMMQLLLLFSFIILFLFFIFARQSN